MLDLTRLRVLATVAACGSVTEAARTLQYSQSSISHHLARLEAETGVKLTQRAGRGIRLTPEGMMLASRAVEVLGRVETAERELAERANLQSGSVRVAGFDSALSSFVATAAATLRAAHPGLTLTLTSMHPDVALEQLRAGDVDVAVVFRYGEEPPPAVRSTHLLDDPMCLLSTEPDQTMEQHRDSNWIAGCERCRKEFVTACDERGFTPRIAYISDDIIVEQAFVAAGLGVTTSPRMALRSHHVARVYATDIPYFRRRIYVATYGEPPDPPATAAFVAALQQAVADPSRRLTVTATSR
jgi:DNA-binding transcriptional LysR family regulator